MKQYWRIERKNKALDDLIDSYLKIDYDYKEVKKNFYNYPENVSYMNMNGTPIKNGKTIIVVIDFDKFLVSRSEMSSYGTWGNASFSGKIHVSWIEEVQGLNLKNVKNFSNKNRKRKLEKLNLIYKEKI